MSAPRRRAPGQRQRSAGGGQAFTSPSVPLPKTTARRVSRLAVECPTCQADLGVKCSPPGTSHVSRQRLAIRLDNQARGI